MHCASCQNLNFQVDWRPAGVAVEPSIRADSTLVVNGRQLILYGGRNQTEPQFRRSTGVANWNLSSAESQTLVAGPDLMQFNLVSKAWHVPNINLSRGSPGPRYGHVARALPGLDAMVLHGGFASDSVKGDLWVYDVTNSAWHKPTISGELAPVARGYHTLTWEPATETKPNEGGFLMHGGLGTAEYQSNHSVLGDVWALQVNCTMTMKVNQTKLLECAAVWTELRDVSGYNSGIQRYGHATTCFFWGNQG